MNKVLAAAFAAVALVAAPAAQAQGDEGKVQIKLLGTYVAPDGKITDLNTDIVGLPAATQTEANDNVVPTVAIGSVIIGRGLRDEGASSGIHTVQSTMGSSRP